MTMTGVPDPNSQQLPGGVTINMPPQAPTAPANPPEPYMSRAEVEALLNQERERVRKEEKDKLYNELGEVGQLRQTVETLNQDLQARQQAEAEALRLAEEEQQRRLQEEASAKDLVDQANQKWEREFQQLNQTLESERILRQKEQEFHQLNNYKTMRVTQEIEAQNIAPQFADLVRGNTPEEIEVSIWQMGLKTAEIAAEVGASNPPPPPGRQIPAALTPSGQPPIDMAGQAAGGGERTFSVDELRDMPIEDYAQIRGQLLNATSQRVRDHGLYAP